MENMNDPSSELRAVDAMNNLGLWLTRITLGRKVNALNAMHSSRLWLIRMTLGH